MWDPPKNQSAVKVQKYQVLLIPAMVPHFYFISPQNVSPYRKILFPYLSPFEINPKKGLSLRLKPKCIL